jgi:hypothetical protein
MRVQRAIDRRAAEGAGAQAQYERQGSPTGDDLHSFRVDLSGEPDSQVHDARPHADAKIS